MDYGNKFLNFLNDNGGSFMTFFFVAWLLAISTAAMFLAPTCP